MALTKNGKKKVDGKKKGNKYEREIAKILQSFWFDSDEELQFHRIPSSGGLRWKKKEGIFGDLIGPDDFPFIVECKNQEGWTFDQLLGDNKGIEPVGKVPKFVAQVFEDTQRCLDETGTFRFPIVILTRNNYPDYFLFPHDALLKDFHQNMNERNSRYLVTRLLENMAIVNTMTINGYVITQMSNMKDIFPKLRKLVNSWEQ